MKVGDIVYHIAAAGTVGQFGKARPPPSGHGLIIERHPDPHPDVYTKYEVLWSKLGEVREHCDYELRVIS
jgi:hypothetical protein